MWVGDDYCNETPACWSNVWYLFVAALGCTILGHRGAQYAAEESMPAWRMCERCYRRWEWRETEGRMSS